MFIAQAIGESLWPKHTGHASATRGGSIASVSSTSHHRFLVLR